MDPEPLMTDLLAANLDAAKEFLQTAEGYEDCVRFLVGIHPEMDPGRIAVHRFGQYDGFMLFVVPTWSDYPRIWYAMAYYGSCSACDAWEEALALSCTRSPEVVEALLKILRDIASSFREMWTGDKTA